MAFRQWFRPPRHVLTIFLSVAVVSAGALGWLAWLLVEQDRALEVQRRQERLEQAADRATAVMQGALADLELQLNSNSTRTPESPPGVVIVMAGPPGIVVRPDGGLLYYPEPGQAPESPPAPLLWVFVLFRFGWIAAMVAMFVADLLRHFPLTFDLSAWTSSSAVPAVLMIAALTAYGFKVSLAGRPAFKDLLADA